jgi:hypothetical protein
MIELTEELKNISASFCFIESQRSDTENEFSFTPTH